MQNIQTINGIILARHNIGEADRLLIIFTREMGKISVIAKGSRKLKSKLAAHIEPLSIGRYQVVEGKTFYILTGAERKIYNEITENIDLYKDMSYIGELINLTYQEKESASELYDVVTSNFENMSSLSPQKRKILLRYLEMKILISLGYKPSFRLCKKCQGRISEKEHYHGDFEGIHCSDCGKSGKIISKDIVKILNLFQEDNDNIWLNINGIEDYNEELNEIIQPFLHAALPRLPKSLEL
jgi:DNA repair protein RecO (recombination protein O)